MVIVVDVQMDEERKPIMGMSPETWMRTRQHPWLTDAKHPSEEMGAGCYEEDHGGIKR